LHVSSSPYNCADRVRHFRAGHTHASVRALQ
jgi:hypothetical protein